MSKRLIKILIIYHLFFCNQIQAIENKILFKVNNHIITSVDVLNEINYLSLINADLQKLNNQKIFEISKNSLIREKIKEIDLNKKFVEIKLEEEYLNGLIKDYSKKLGFKNTDSFYNEFKKKKHRN